LARHGRGATGVEFNAWIGRAHCRGEPFKTVHISRSSRPSHLPMPPEFIAHFPMLHLVRLRMSVGGAQFSHRRTSGTIAVFDPTRCLFRSPTPRVDANHRFATYRAAKRDEFVRPEGIRFDRSPSVIRLGRSLLDGPDPILPMVSADKVA